MKIHFFDFDGCLMDAPLPSVDGGDGEEVWTAFHETPYPHKGWWSKPESLCLQAFDIQPFYKMDKILRESISDPDTQTVLLTNRLGKLEKHVRAVLEKHGYTLDDYTFRSSKNKGERIRAYVEKWQNVEEVVFYDDDPGHLIDAREAMWDYKPKIQLFRVDNGELIPFKN